jgi:hypothetical protein
MGGLVLVAGSKAKVNTSLAAIPEYKGFVKSSHLTVVQSIPSSFFIFSNFFLSPG